MITKKIKSNTGLASKIWIGVPQRIKSRMNLNILYICSDTNSTNLIYLFNNNRNVLSPYFWVLKTLRVKSFTHKQRIPYISKFFENPLSITAR